jgi:hypothetical protein
MSWRELMKINIPTQYSQNPQKEPQMDSFEGIEDIEHRNEDETEPESQTVKALGYGCSGCGNRIYKAVKGWKISELPAVSTFTHEHTSVTHWQCETCETVYEIIGGTRGLQFIN